MTKTLTAEEIAQSALGLCWLDVESQARMVSNHAEELIETYYNAGRRDQAFQIWIESLGLQADPRRKDFYEGFCAGWEGATDGD